MSAAAVTLTGVLFAGVGTVTAWCTRAGWRTDPLRVAIPSALLPPASTQAGAPPVTGQTHRSCPGALVTHQDGRTTCHGGREDCWDGTSFNHATTVGCRDLSHGCGQCADTVPAPDRLNPPGTPARPDPAAGQACARGCGRHGEVLLAASGSLPTLVCPRCATAITRHQTRPVADPR